MIPEDSRHSRQDGDYSSEDDERKPGVEESEVEDLVAAAEAAEAANRTPSSGTPQGCVATSSPYGRAALAARDATEDLASQPLACRLSTVTVVEVFPPGDSPPDCHFRAVEQRDGGVVVVHRSSSSDLDWSGHPEEGDLTEDVRRRDIIHQSNCSAAALSPILVHGGAGLMTSMTTGDDRTLPVLYQRKYV